MAHLIPLDEAEEVLAENLCDHAYVVPIRAAVTEVVEEANDVAGVGAG
jgi:hypothetical protein